MKSKIAIIRSLSVSLAILAACQQQEIIPDIIDSHYPDDGVVRIANVLQGAPTRATADGTANYLGSTLALSIDYGDAHRYTSLNRLWTNVSEQWTPEQQMLWKDATTPVKLFAYAPYQNNSQNLTQVPFSVSTTQDKDGILNSDLVGFAQNNFQPTRHLDTDGKVALAMMHKLAKLNVRLTYGNQWGDTPPQVMAVSINGTRISGTYNATTATFIGVDTQPAAQAISMYANHVAALEDAPAYTQYEAIILPQEVDLGTALVQIELADNTRYVYTPTANHNFISGTETAINLRIGKDNVELADNITVTPWLDATDDKTGDTEEDLPFPDRSFVKYLHETFGVPLDAYGEIDVTNADVLTRLQQIEELSIQNQGFKSLKGLEYLTNLTELDCSGNSLTSFELFNHNTLQRLNCSNNQLTTLTLFALNQLTDLDCSNNPLSTLLLEKTKNIERLDCSHLNLSSVPVSNIIALQYLDISYNNLTSFSIIGNSVNLTTLNCSNNKITNLWLDDHPKLASFDCSDNEIRNLSTGTLTALETLYCHKNKLTTLDLSPLSTLTAISCYQNKLSTLDVSGLTLLDLGQLYCGDQTNNRENLLTLTYGNNAPGTTFNPDKNPGVTAVEKP